MRTFIPLLIFLFTVPKIHAQDSASTKVRDQLEEAFEDIDSELSESAAQLIQFLQELEKNPVNINTADITDLIQVPGISFITARSIIAYRTENPFERIEEIQQVSGIGQVTFQKISPYITVGNDTEIKAKYLDSDYWLNNSRIEIISRLQQPIEEQIGYSIPDTLGGYSGSSSKYYQRFKLQSNHLSFNLTQEKDAGEPLKHPTGFDFNSMHLGLMNNGKLKKLIVGDFSLSFGQGLVIWSGGAFGKGREVINSVGRNERGLRPYTSAQESNFFRGVAATIGDKNEITFFYSSVPQTASIVGQDSVRFPSSSGFHRTLNEIERKDNVNQTTVGSRLRVNTRIGLFGISGYTSRFNSTVIRGNSISNLNDFNGSTNAVFGLDYRALIGRSLIFGEVARSNSDAFASLIGIESNVGSSTDLAILYRDYGSKFISIFGDGFGELSGSPQNERGLYLGLRHRISNYTFSTYFDQFFFEAPNAGINVPSSGIDVLALIEAKFNSKLSGYILIRNESKDEIFDSTVESGRLEQLVGTRSRSNFRIQIQHQPSKKIRMRSRAEWVQFKSEQNNPETGFLLFQDLRVILSHKLLLDTRFSLFDTDSFDARVYQFENDLRYVLTNVALNDKGQRWYLVFKYDLTNELEFSAKVSRTIIEDAQFLSSGLNQIDGNERTVVGIQLRWAM